MDQVQIEERIRRCSHTAKHLIVKLDTLAGRIDGAQKNGNRELVEYYEQLFAKASTEFMTGVEVILDDCYALNGQKRSRTEEAPLSAEALDALVAQVAYIAVEKPSAIQSEYTPLLENPLDPPSPVPVPKGAPGREKKQQKLDLRG